jgi:membrane protein
LLPGGVAVGIGGYRLWVSVQHLRSGLGVGVRRVRRRFGWADHLVRAAVRYDDADGGRLAAAVTYYAFFATFSLALLGFAIFGYVVRNPALLTSMQEQLPVNLPRLDAAAVRTARGPAGLIGFIVWPISGVFWVDSLRSSMRAIWRLPEYPGSFLRRQLVNLAVLTGIGGLLAVSLAVAAGAQNLLGWLLFDLTDTGGTGRLARSAAGFALGLAANTVLSMAVVSGLPRLRLSWRRILGPAVVIAAGVQILTSVGHVYINATQANPAYHLVTAAVGLLVFLNLLNQLILFAAALTATGTTGAVRDLAAEPAPPSVSQPAPPRRPLTYARRIRPRRSARRNAAPGRRTAPSRNDRPDSR